MDPVVAYEPPTVIVIGDPEELTRGLIPTGVSNEPDGFQTIARIGS